MHRLPREHFPEIQERKVYPFSASPSNSPRHSRLSTPALSRTGELAQRGRNLKHHVTSHGIELVGEPGPALHPGMAWHTARPSSTPGGSRAELFREPGTRKQPGVARPSSTPGGSRAELFGEPGATQHPDAGRPSSTVGGKRAALFGELGTTQPPGIARPSSTASGKRAELSKDFGPGQNEGMSRPSSRAQTRMARSTSMPSSASSAYRKDMTGLDHTYPRHNYDPIHEWGLHSVANDLNPWLSDKKLPKWGTTSGMYGNHYRHPEQTYIRIVKERMPVFSIVV